MYGVGAYLSSILSGVGEHGGGVPYDGSLMWAVRGVGDSGVLPEAMAAVVQISLSTYCSAGGGLHITSYHGMYT